MTHGVIVTLLPSETKAKAQSKGRRRHCSLDRMRARVLTSFTRERFLDQNRLASGRVRTHTTLPSTVLNHIFYRKCPGPIPVLHAGSFTVWRIVVVFGLSWVMSWCHDYCNVSDRIVHSGHNLWSGFNTSRATSKERRSEQTWHHTFKSTISAFCNVGQLRFWWATVPSLELSTSGSFLTVASSISFLWVAPLRVSLLVYCFRLRIQQDIHKTIMSKSDAGIPTIVSMDVFVHSPTTSWRMMW